MKTSRLPWDGTAEPVSRDQILRHARGQGNINFPCSADHEQDWQPYPVDSYSAICVDDTYIHTYILPRVGRHRASKPQGSSKRVLPWQATMDKLICASLSHTHYLYEVGMLKVIGDPNLHGTWAGVWWFLKKNQNTPRPSEHPPVMGGKMSKRLGGIKGCKYKTSSWHSNRFPDADNIGSTV